MRIAQVYHDFRPGGGAERHIQALTADLQCLGHEVTIVSEHPPYGFPQFRTRFRRWALPASALRLAQWVRTEGVGLIHAHSRIAAMLAGLAVRLYRVPLIVTSHILPEGFERMTPWGDATICVSEAVRASLLQKFRLPPERAHVIHNGIDVPLEQAGPLFGLPPIVSMVARFVPGKGHELFLALASRLLAAGFPGTFLLAGDGPLLDGFRRGHSHDRIVFLGHRSDVPRLLAGSTISVVCSESEAFPYAVLESLSQGTPVLATDCGGPAEAIRAGFNGHLFPVGDAEALERLILNSTAGSSFAPRDEIARECRLRFSRRSMVNSILTVYRDFCPEV